MVMSSIGIISKLVVNKANDNMAEEWENVTEIIPAFAKAGEPAQPQETEPKETKLIASESVVEYFKSRNLDLCQAKNEVVTRMIDKMPIMYKMFCCLGTMPPDSLLEEAALVMSIAKTPYEDGNETHFQILLTLFKQLTGDRLDCPRYGSHWEQIGFQGNDPATDLRGVGMLGLLHPLFLVSTPELFPFGIKVFKISLKEDQNFPFMVLSINLTRIAYDILMDGLLNSVIDKEFWYSFNYFYCAVLFQYYHIWKTEHKSIKDSGYVLQRVEKQCRTDVNGVIDVFGQHLLTYSVEEKQQARENWTKRS